MNVGLISLILWGCDENIMRIERICDNERWWDLKWLNWWEINEIMIKCDKMKEINKIVLKILIYNIKYDDSLIKL